MNSDYGEAWYTRAKRMDYYIISYNIFTMKEDLSCIQTRPPIIFHIKKLMGSHMDPNTDLKNPFIKGRG